MSSQDFPFLPGMPTGPSLTSEAENDQNLRLTAYRASESYWFTDTDRQADAKPGDLINTAADIEWYFRTGQTTRPLG